LLYFDENANLVLFIFKWEHFHQKNKFFKIAVFLISFSVLVFLNVDLKNNFCLSALFHFFILIWTKTPKIPILQKARILHEHLDVLAEKHTLAIQPFLLMLNKSMMGKYKLPNKGSREFD